MPAKPVWYGQLDRIISQLRALPRPYVDRATVEALLGVGRRRAQQIMASCVTDRVGANGLADRDALIAHLSGIAAGDDSAYEVRRRRRLAGVLERLHTDLINRPRLLVEAPTRVVESVFSDLPEGVRLEPGRITVEFDEPRQALEKLLALAMAISNDFARFERETA